MKFTLLASGSKGNCCLIENKETKIMIDCGTTKKYLSQRFDELNIRISDLQACFITHTHSDHISCIKMFQELPIYCEEDLNLDTQIQIKENECFQIQTMKIESIRLSHDSKCLGYIIRDNQHKLVYITDTGYLKEAHYEKIRNADYYIFESNHDLGMLVQSRRPEFVKNRIRSANGHLCNEDAAMHLIHCMGENTKEIVLAHISEEANTEELALSVLEEALEDSEIHPKVQAAKQFEITCGGQND